MLRVLAFGNKYRRDDAVAIEITENLKNNLKKRGIDILICNIDYEYCFESVNEDDYLIILLAAHSKKNPGSLQLCKISDAVEYYKKNNPANPFCSNIFTLMNLFHLSYSGYIISINVKDVNFGVGLSKELENDFMKICKKIEFLITNIQNNIFSL